MASVFALLSGKAVSEISILSIRMTDFTLVRIFIPPVVSGILLRTLFICNQRSMALKAYWQICEKRFPLMRESGLLEFTVPSGSPITAGYSAIADGTRYGRIQAVVERCEAFIMYLAFPLAFSIYAFIRLFGEFGVPHALVWISLVVTVSAKAVGILCIKVPETLAVEDEGTSDGKDAHDDGVARRGRWGRIPELTDPGCDDVAR